MQLKNHLMQMKRVAQEFFMKHNVNSEFSVFSSVFQKDDLLGHQGELDQDQSICGKDNWVHPLVCGARGIQEEGLAQKKHFRRR